MPTTARRSVTLLILSALASAVVGVAHPGSAAAEPAVGVTGGTGVYYLVSFDTAGGPLTSQRRITGLTQTDFVGMTLRPSTGGLVFSTSSNPGGVNDTTGRAYSLDYATAVATPMSTPTFSSTLIDSTGLGLAISPVTDQLRVTSTSSENLRVNASSGAFIATDTPLSGAARGPAIAYDRSVVGATATTLYGIDTNSANLIRIGGVDGVPSADGGQVLQVGTTGVGLNASVSMAISPSTGIAYMSNPVSGGTTAIHTLNLTTGAGTAAGVVDGTLLDMVLLPPSTVQVAAASTRAAETAGAASITVSRTGDLRLPASVQYSTADGTARGASDFVATSGSLEFPAGVTSRVVQVPLIPDAIAETAETFTLTVSGATGGASLGGTTTTVTIDDTVVPVVPVVPPAVDRTAPKVLVLALAPRSAKVIGRAGVRATFSCSEGCTASARLLLGRTALGAVARTRLTAAGIGALRVTTTKLGQRRLTAALATARTHRARLTYELTVADASGNRRTVRLPLVAIG